MQLAKSVRRAMGLMLLGLAVAATPATAARLQPVDFTNAAFAPTAAGLTSIPIGDVDFCRRFPNECRPNARVVEDVHLTPQNWRQLLDVNSYYNTTIVPETDMQLYHVEEFWTYPHGFGDCEDIALAKQRKLTEDGWPASALLITVVRDAGGEGHAVLMVRTDRGDLILDNQDSVVRDWKDSPYHFLKRQSQSDPGEWVAITDARLGLVLAGNNSSRDETTSATR
jgi:predicted transglutaminase-like cysteine proteinase